MSVPAEARLRRVLFAVYPEDMRTGSQVIRIGFSDRNDAGVRQYYRDVAGNCLKLLERRVYSTRFTLLNIHKKLLKAGFRRVIGKRNCYYLSYNTTHQFYNIFMSRHQRK